MIHVDPAHPAFENLPREEQARIYHRNMGWDLNAIADEFGVERRTVRTWVDPHAKALRKACRDRARGKPAPAPQAPRDYSEVYRLHSQGMPTLEIVASLGLPKGTVYRVVREYRARQQEAA